jgi:type IV pilus assembly protein PilA
MSLKPACRDERKGRCWMFQRFQAIREEREGGFTLIELLVVVIIIAILAAIAIPVFLNQREKGWIAQSESAVKNAATAMETYAADNGGSYAGATILLLEGAGFNQTDDVVMAEPVADADYYCVQANHASLDDNYRFTSESGRPEVGSCPAAPPA